MIENIITKYLHENPYALEVDKVSLANVKAQIKNLLSGLFQ